MKKSIIFTINKLNPSAIASLLRLERQDFRVVVLRDKRVAPQDRSNIFLGSLTVSELETDFFDEARLKEDISQFYGKVLGVISRGESSIQYLARLSDACSDWGLRLPTSKSLEIATDKQRMRHAFMENAPEITPAYMQVSDASGETLAQIADVVGYPLVIKPANLASSLLIQRCDTQEQAEQSIASALETIKELYRDSGRFEEPVLIVEQMLEGELYSVDAYVTDEGEIICCPAVGYVTGQSVGVDDFFLYRRSAPVSLSEDDWKACQRAVEKGIRAIGLSSTAAHVELCRTRDSWKIIEIGPRVGRYRIEMYREAFGIEHSDNDIKVRLGMVPRVSLKPKAFCSCYSVYPYEEGVLERIDNIDQIEQLASLVQMKRMIEDGSTVHHAKHGGHALAEVILAHEDSDQFQRDTEWFESNVKAKVTTA